MSSCCHHHEKDRAVVAPAPEGSLFTCPMHPEILRDQPGDCPKCGMALEPLVPTGETDQETRSLARKFTLSVILALPLFLLAMAPMAGLHPLPPGVSPWVEFLLSLPVLFWCGAPIWQKGFRSFAEGHLNMFSLIALGTGAAFLDSVAVLFLSGSGRDPHALHGGLYFEAAATIMVLVLLGQWLEARGRARAGTALRELLDLTPATARLVTEGMPDREVPVAELHAGDVVRILPGEKIPADGTLTQGWSSLDESMLTGEPLPVEKTPGSAISAGTINRQGSFLMRVTSAGEETSLSRIILMVAQAQRSQAPIQQLADRFAAVFVPVVLGIALVTAVAWMLLEGSWPHALQAAVSVLMIACPCALGLATPMALTVGIGRAARHGILIREAATLQRLAGATLMALDKTGTLTEGKPRLASLLPLSGFTKEELLLHAAAAERGSEHPLARAVMVHATEQGVQIPETTGFTAHPGGGISARIDGAEVLAGSLAFLESRGVPVASLGTIILALEAGAGVIAVAIAGKPAGLILVQDTIRPSAAASLEALRHLGVRPAMLTGDREETARFVAGQLGITLWKGGLTPGGKAEQLALWKREGYRTAMAGDGINDAPALASADASIAMGSGSDIAKETAGIILLHPSLEGIVTATRLSREILRTIRQNLFFAFAYNILGIPIAAGILYPWTGLLLSPMIAAAAMSLSSVSVIANSLRLRRMRF
jgi:Cu+-exporting ATPase